MARAKLLITGINGLIGTLLNGALHDSYDLCGLDRVGPFSNRVVQADIADYQQLARAFRQFSPVEHVIHLAGNPDTTATWQSVLEANIIGTRNVYEAAREFKIKRVIFASSNHVTGAYEGFEPNLHLHIEHEPERVSPHHPIRPDSDYGVSKAFGEAVARYYCARWGIESVCLRIGTVLRDDDPTTNARHRKTWLSHRDLIQLIQKSLTSNVTFGIYYGISNNKGAFWSLSNAHADLNFEPVDDGSTRSAH